MEIEVFDAIQRQLSVGDKVAYAIDENWNVGVVEKIYERKERWRTKNIVKVRKVELRYLQSGYSHIQHPRNLLIVPDFSFLPSETRDIVETLLGV
jgi:hypothetical protein